MTASEPAAISRYFVRFLRFPSSSQHRARRPASAHRDHGRERDSLARARAGAPRPSRPPPRSSLATRRRSDDVVDPPPDANEENVENPPRRRAETVVVVLLLLLLLGEGLRDRGRLLRVQARRPRAHHRREREADRPTEGRVGRGHGKAVGGDRLRRAILRRRLGDEPREEPERHAGGHRSRAEERAADVSVRGVGRGGVEGVGRDVGGGGRGERLRGLVRGARVESQSSFRRRRRRRRGGDGAAHVHAAGGDRSRRDHREGGRGGVRPRRHEEGSLSGRRRRSEASRQRGRGPDAVRRSRATRL